VHAVHDEGESGGCRRWALEAEPDAAPAVSAAVIGAGLALHAIGFETRNLETLFAQVNRGGEAAPAEEPAHAV
ncbi:MAG: hypothetical protein KGL18_05305, partial [Burkholderiales bacterium]|nr:hypothetical protein [Burkholderiales bacterium]